jgi:hypothetical protein
MTAALGEVAAADLGGAGAGAEASAGAGAGTVSKASKGSGGGMLGNLVGSSVVGKADKAILDTVAPQSAARKYLLAEFCACMVVLGFSPLTGKAPTAGAWMKRGSAIMGVFFVLGLVATAGRGASRAAAGFGALVTLVLLISDRSIFVTLAKKFGKGVGEDSDDDGADWADEPENLDPMGDAVDGGVSKLDPATDDEIAEQLQDILGRGYGVR